MLTSAGVIIGLNSKNVLSEQRQMFASRTSHLIIRDKPTGNRMSMATKASNTPWIEAIKQVLGKAGQAMHYSEIAQAIIDGKLRKDVGATPASTVNANVSWSLKYEPDKSPFVRVSRGVYDLREISTTGKLPTSAAEAPLGAEVEVTEDSAGIIQAFGMFWRRDLVDWGNTPELLGQQQHGAALVDFCEQRGVYLLHDVQRVVYVGQAADQPLGRRLNQHTADRLNGRWDRFSWFGIRRVMADGKLVDPDLKSLTSGDIITTLEALFIEGLEPPQNRRRGEDFSAVEYLQADNPKQKSRAIKAQLAELMAKI